MIFISPQKLFAFTRYLNVCLDFLVMYKNRSIKKVRLVSDLVASQPRKAIAIQILPNISRSKRSQAMKFYTLTEYDRRNIFHEKSYTNFGG